jgi:hypothetical protein
VAIDGFNLIITLEVALSGGLLLDGRDGALRDLAGLRGSYHAVEETDRAIELALDELAELAPSSARFYLDAPVSNSGRLRGRILEHARGRAFPVEVELVPNADAQLTHTPATVTSDSMILDRCPSWLNLVRWIVDRRLPRAWRPWGPVTASL